MILLFRKEFKKVGIDMFQFNSAAWWRRFIIMITGIVLMGLGICLFKLSLMGNDPSSAMVMALGNILGIPFSILLIGFNLLWFIVEICMKREIIGPGTFVNWFCVGMFADLWTSVITSQLTIPEHYFARVLVMLVGVIILSLSCALYQTADMGIAPYDALSLIMEERTPLPYFWCRMITDSICAVIAFLAGGIVGLGTLVCALGLGPFINFFTNTVAKKLCYGKININFLPRINIQTKKGAL